MKLQRHAWKETSTSETVVLWDGRREIGWQSGRGEFNGICNDLLRRRRRRRREKIPRQKLRARFTQPLS